MMKRKYSAIASPSELSSTASDLRVFTKRNAFGANPNLCLANAGFLGQLPAEILCQTFSFLPLADIGNVALASNALRMFVADWINSKGCLKRITELPEPDEGLLSVMKVSDALKHLSDPSQPAYRFSILCKRLTCLLATGDRIQFAFKMFHRVLSYQLENAPDQDQRSKDWSTTLFITQYCGMIHAFTRGWDESEFASLIKVLDARFDIGEKLKSFLAQNNRDDVCVASEMRIRLLLRSLTWDFAGKDYGHKAVSPISYFTV